MDTATHIGEAVRAGKLDPVTVVADVLARISAGDGAVGAFRRVRAEQALAEARSVAERPDLARLPLAGVPIAVKDVIAVAGEHAEWGSAAGTRLPFAADGGIAARLRAAGAVIVGLTRVPELCLWPTTDTPGAVVRNPWRPDYTPGGSSGGSAAAVAAGLVPLAHGTDALASVRSPAAICGLVGVCPGTGTVRAGDASVFSGMYTHGPLATTVADAALLLSVLAERPALAEVSAPASPLRIATSTRLPMAGRHIPEEFVTAVDRTADVLRDAGHTVEEATPRYGNLAPPLLARWLAAPGEPAQGLSRRQLQPRTRTHLRGGTLVRRAGLVREGAKRAWIARAEEFFTHHDILITPTLATLPPKARHWSEKSWLSNALPAIALSSFLGPWDLAGYPALSLPAGQHPSGLPIGVQIITSPGGEPLLLSLAAQLESLQPWQRTAPPGRAGA
ncbi:amidase [Streptomyces polygonati]|uniref:Amidase n=1 Tax=Streptomyces polygonati TaxID=1617087 RepID=A0ABV8HIV7_9ACTN